MNLRLLGADNANAVAHQFSDMRIRDTGAHNICLLLHIDERARAGIFSVPDAVRFKDAAAGHGKGVAGWETAKPMQVLESTSRILPTISRRRGLRLSFVRCRVLFSP